MASPITGQTPRFYAELMAIKWPLFFSGFPLQGIGGSVILKDKGNPIRR